MTERCGWPTALQADGLLLVVRMRAPLDPREVQRVCGALRSALEADPTRVVVCHVDGAPDVTVVGALARLGLLCRRLDVTVRVRSTGTSREALEALLELTGLAGAVPARLAGGRQPEAREERGVEEVVHVRDAPA
jgi:hypothetical protein